MAGEKVGSSYLEVEPRAAKAFGSKLEKQINGDAAKAGKAGGAAYAGGFSTGTKKLVGLAGGFLAFEKAAGFIGDSVDAASDLNETVNKSNIIFGKNASAVDAWAAKSDKALGLSKQAALDSTASFGDMFTQLGLGRNRATKMSESVVQLGADLGSFNNLGTDDVLERIAGGFRGEYDALQKVIPNISAARVQQEALRQTHKKSVTDLTAAEKATATLAIIQHDGARAAGDFARTSTGLANSQKIQGAEMANLKTKIGQGLLPIQLKLTRFIADEAIPAASEFVDQMHDGTGAGGDFADALHKTLTIGRGVLGFFEAIPGPVKKYGAELLIAAFALNKVNNGLAASGQRFDAWIAKTGGAEAGATRTTKAAYTLGVGLRNLAGAGGILAVVDGNKRLSKSTTESGRAMGALETTAGAAAAGFSVGGPWGAAIGTVVGFGKAILSDTQAVDDHISSLKTYAGTLDEVTGAITRTTRATALERLEKSGLIDKTRDLNISDRDAVQAALGNEAARKRVSAALGQAVDQGKNYEALKVAEGLHTETGAILDSRVAQLKKNLALAATKEEAQKIQNKLDKLARTNANPNVTIGGAGQAIDQLNAIQTLIKDITHSKGGITTPKSDLAGLLGGKLAGGGPVRAGVTYLVGEKGPELFTAPTSGDIIPNGRLRATAMGADSVKKLRAELIKLKGTLGKLQSSYADLAASTADAFRPDLFSGTLGDLIGGESKSLALLPGVLSAVDKLTGEGVSAAFLQQLFASGNSKLILALAGGPAAQAQTAAARFDQIQSLSGQIGQAVAAQSPLTSQIAGVRAELVAIRKELATHPGKNGAATAKALNHTASTARRRRRRGA
jgi:hypothetical protein